MEGKPDEKLEQPQELSSDEVHSTLASIREIDSAMAQLRSEREQQLEAFWSKLRRNSVPEDAKIAAAAMMTKSAKKMEHKFSFLTSVQEAVEKGRGGLVAWTDVDLG